MESFKEIIEEIKEVYLKDHRPFYLMYSGGKDSSFLLLKVWEMLRTLSKEQLTKPVHVICSDTLVETPMMTSYVKKAVHLIEEKAKEEGLPIYSHMVTPEMKNRFFYQTLGKGNPIPTPDSPFAWCNAKLKRMPTQHKLLELTNKMDISFGFDPNNATLLGFEGDSVVVMLLGVRDEESARRKQSIEKHEVEGTKFGRHADFNFIQTFMPIRLVSSDELWFGFPSVLPWGITLEELQFQYGESFMECGIQHDSTKKKACGSLASRSGCWVCGMSRTDRMLLQWIEDGYSEMKYLLEWKQTLIDMRNDIRFREPEKRREFKKLDKRMTESINQFSIFDDRPDENQLGEVDEWVPGSMTIEGRKLMFRKLMFVQMQTGYKLIQREEAEAIIACWKEEGYSVTLEDLQPLDWKFDGSIEYKTNRDYNKKASTNQAPFFHVYRHFQKDSDEIHWNIKQRVTATSKSFYYVLTGIKNETPFVRNTVIFYVCSPDVTSKEQAEQLIDKFLGDMETFDLYGNIKETVRSAVTDPTLDSTTKISWLCDFLLTDLMVNGVGAQRKNDCNLETFTENAREWFEPNVLDEMNKSSVHLGYSPVLPMDRNGQYSFAI